MIVFTPAVIALCILTPICAYFIVKWLFQKDTAVENKRRNAGKLATKLEAVGLKRIPAFLIDYSVGDYSGMYQKIDNLADLMLEGDGTALLAEVDTVFKNVLSAKVKTAEGKAYIAAVLADANAIAA